ncbi:unnamed protein product [Sphagnum compactum]
MQLSQSLNLINFQSSSAASVRSRSVQFVPVSSASQTFSILHIGAHTDLRETFEDSHYSHACVNFQLYKMLPQPLITSVGVRNISEEEVAWLEQKQPNVNLFWARNQDGWNLNEIVETLSDNVYLTVDVSGLDPAIMPATGAPEPGGMGLVSNHRTNKIAVHSQKRGRCRFRRIGSYTQSLFQNLPSPSSFIKRSAIASRWNWALLRSIFRTLSDSSTAVADAKWMTIAIEIRRAPVSVTCRYLSDFKPGKAILSFSKELLNSKQNLSNPSDRQRLSVIYSLIGRAFSFDENDESASWSTFDCGAIGLEKYRCQSFIGRYLRSSRSHKPSDKLFKELDSLPDDNVTVEVVKAGRLGRHLDYKKEDLYLRHCIATTFSGTTSALYSVLGRTLLREGFSKDAADTILTASRRPILPYVAKILEALSAQCNQKNEEAERIYREAGQINPDDRKLDDWRGQCAGTAKQER